MSNQHNYEDLASYGALNAIPALMADQLETTPFLRLGIAASLGNVVSQAELIEKDELCTHDELTGLLNRRGILEYGREQLRLSGNTAVIYLDADKFKVVNDKHGHKAGDDLLREIASTISENVRSSDLVGRIGGDEFVVVFDTTPRQDSDQKLTPQERVTIVLERIQQSLAKKIEGTEIAGYGVGISGGFAIFDQVVHRNLDDLMQEADGKLYENKEARRIVENLLSIN